MTNNHFTKTCITIFFFCFSGALNAQTDSIDVFIKNEMRARKIPGLQLAIIKDGKIIKTGNYGLANVQDSIPVSDKTVFTINSITKAFTGVAVMQLVEAGKLELSEPVSRYLADLPVLWKAVTIQQLLSHTSGIPDIVDEEEAVLILPDPEEAWKKVLASPMEYLPGEKFSYNQTNYLLLGLVIDKLSGMPFQEFIIEGQLLKAAMPRTITSGFGATKEVIANAAASYQYRKGKFSNMFFSFPPFLQTAAGMSSTAREMAQWVIALERNELLIHNASIEALWKPAVLNNGKTGGFNSLLNGYAAGWPVVDRKEHSAVAPVGGGRSALFIYPKDKLSVIVLTNLSGALPDTFIDELAGLFIPSMKKSNGFGSAK